MPSSLVCRVRSWSAQDGFVWPPTSPLHGHGHRVKSQPSPSLTFTPSANNRLVTLVR
jgi:hypothetical protein